MKLCILCPVRCNTFMQQARSSATAVFIFCIALCIFVIGDTKDSNLMYRLNVQVKHTDDKPSLIGAWSGHVTH